MINAQNSVILRFLTMGPSENLTFELITSIALENTSATADLTLTDAEGNSVTIPPEGTFEASVEGGKSIDQIQVTTIAAGAAKLSFIGVKVS